jgi:hypothetical protein
MVTLTKILIGWTLGVVAWWLLTDDDRPRLGDPQDPPRR